MSGLPEGWSQTYVADLIAHDGLFSDGDWIESKDQDPSGTIRLLQLADIGDGEFQDRSRRYINETKFEELRCTELREGDVLVARMPEPLGRACLMPKLPQRCITVVDVAVIRSGSNGISSKWLQHFLNSPDVRQRIEVLSSGTTRRRISRSNLGQIELPVPPINEQKRIADKLDVLLTKIDGCRERLERVPSVLKRFRRAVLTAAVSGQLTEDWRAAMNLDMDTWQRKLGEDVFPYVTSGSRGWATYYAESGALFLRVGNLNRDTIELDLTKVQHVNPPESAEGKRTRILAGDILISITADIGMVGLIREDMGEAYINQHLCLARQTGDYSSAYLAYYLASPLGGVAQFAEAQRGAIKAGLTLGDIRTLILRIPRREEQDEIVRRVEVLFGYADRLEARHEASLARVDRLTQVSLAKAFRGELVPQDPNDEPATLLLERIRAAKAEAPVAPKRDISRKPSMTKLTEEAIRETIRHFPKDMFSFDELRQSLFGDYEALKEIVFALLGEGEPSIMQVFDQDSEEMRFVRSQK